MKRVAIIGGGLAGLTCAHSLRERGIASTVFEADARPGGRDSAGPFLLSPDLFRNTFQLIRTLGLERDLISIPAYAGQFYKGRIYRHSVASATGLLSFKGLNFADKVLLPKMAYLLARYSSHLDFHDPEKGLQFDNETIASFVKRELSQSVLNYVAGPLISTLFFYGSDETSSWLYLVLAKHMHNVRMSTLRGGLGRLAVALSDGLDLVRERRISEIVAEADSYVVDGQRFSDIVFAIPGDRVRDIQGLKSLLSQEDIEFFTDCRYQPIISVWVATARPVDGACYALSIPRVEKFSAATISFHDFIDPESVADVHGLLTISGGGPDVDSASLIAELNRLYPAEPLSLETRQWKSGMPKFPPGRYRAIVAFHRRSRRQGLHFCGDYLLGPFVEGAITTAMAAARACSRGL
jgi:oxygen-dependent protoporphyrinogen oxidase